MKSLIYLEGGPYHGKVFESKALLGKPEIPSFLANYKWTSRRITSEATGKSAQIWQYSNSGSATIEETESSNSKD